MAISTQNRTNFAQLRAQASQIEDQGVRAEVEKGLSQLEKDLNKVDIDSVIGGLLSGGYKVGGHAGRTFMAGGLMVGLGGLAKISGENAIQGVADAVREFKADMATRGTGDAIWLAIPDAGEVAISAAVAVFLAACVLKTAQHYKDQTFSKAADKVAA